MDEGKEMEDKGRGRGERKCEQMETKEKEKGKREKRDTMIGRRINGGSEGEK